MKQMRKFCYIILLLILTYPLYACQIPVFRYALERWLPDYYEAVVIHRGELSQQQEQLLRRLQQAGRTEGTMLNLWVQDIDFASHKTKEITNLLKTNVPAKLPVLAVWYPGHKGHSAPLWLGDFSSTVTTLIESSVRHKISQKLLDGDVSVWIFVESGDTKKDNTKLQLLKHELQTSALQLEKAFNMYWGADVSYEFSVLSVSRSDPKEGFLLTMLLNSEPDLHKYVDEPMVFPVFGRGRVLYALVGDEINSHSIQETMAFLAGPCGCQVKALNPGVDLLMAANWDASVTDSYSYEIEMVTPELTGVMPETSMVSENTNIQKVELEKEKSQKWGIIHTAGLMMVVLLVAVVIGTIFVSRFIKR